MPITNIVIILFILAMIYMGTVQGLFSSFLHLMVVIAAGTLAFALWEPLTVGLLIKYVPLFAWTLGLLVPFGVLLIVLRMTSDKLVPANMNFPGIMNVILGGGCGLLSGLLTAGIVVIGLGFLPLGPDLGGYQPYSVAAGGVLQPTGGKLWVPVNSVAGNFYSGLSRGAFASKTPMALYKPELDTQMSLIRVRNDYVSIVASPEAVEVTGAYITDTAGLVDGLSPEMADILGSKINQPGAKLVIVDTEWSVVQNTVDGDRALRLPSSHVRLIAQSTESGNKDVILEGPVGFTKPIGDGRVFYPYNSGSQMAYTTAPKSTFGFVYIVPAGYEPMFPQVRFLRLNMPEDNQIVSNTDEVLAVLGQPEPAAPEVDDEATADAGPSDTNQATTTVSDRTGMRAGSYVLDVTVTNRLPITASKNTISGLTATDGDNGAYIVSGSTGSARKPGQSVGARNKIVGFDIAPHEAMVRVKVTSDQNQTIFGAGLSAAAALNPIWLEDNSGNKWYVTAWVWQKASKDQEIHFDAFTPIQSSKQTPISRMGDGDDFYFYFSITRPQAGQPPLDLVRYSIGDISSQEFEPPLRIESQ